MVNNTAGVTHEHYSVPEIIDTAVQFSSLLQRRKGDPIHLHVPEMVTLITVRAASDGEVVLVHRDELRGKLGAGAGVEEVVHRQKHDWGPGVRLSEGEGHLSLFLVIPDVVVDLLLS